MPPPISGATAGLTDATSNAGEAVWPSATTLSSSTQAKVLRMLSLRSQHSCRIAVYAPVQLVDPSIAVHVA